MSSISLTDKNFYKRILSLALPIMAQNAVSTFVNMLDNVMVGRVGTVEMTGVAVGNELLFVFILAIFGAVSGIGIFGAQFAGARDQNGLRYVLRFKVLFTLGISVLFCLIFLFGGDWMIGIFLRGEGSPQDAANALAFGKQYLLIMLIGAFPYAIAQSYASTLREVGRAVMPMVTTIIAMSTNLILNYVLIYGKLGAPRMGVAGAALATVISRFVEMGILMIYTHRLSTQMPFVKGLYRSLRVPLSLIKSIIRKGLPLILNELCWSVSVTLLTQCYSTRGLHVVASMTINHTFWNLFAVAFMACGNAVGILAGHSLGADEPERARDDCYKAIFFAAVLGIIFGALFFICARWIPDLYNTTEEVKHTATVLMCLGAISMPFDAIVNVCYFCMRAGGKMLITILFDSCFQACLCLPAAFLLSRFTGINIFWLYGIVQNLLALKMVIGLILVRKDFWLQNIIDKENV